MLFLVPDRGHYYCFGLVVVVVVVVLVVALRQFR